MASRGRTARTGRAFSFTRRTGRETTASAAYEILPALIPWRVILREPERSERRPKDRSPSFRRCRDPGAEQRAPVRREPREARVPLAARGQLWLGVASKTREQSHRERGVDLRHLVQVILVEAIEPPHGASQERRLFHDVVVSQSEAPALTAMRRRCIEERPLDRA